MKKAVVLAIKYCPIIIAVFLYLNHFLETILYKPLLSSKITTTVVVVSIWIVILLFSIYLKFCIYHRVILYYILTLSMYLIWSPYYSNLNKEVWSMLIFGITIIYIIIIITTYILYGDRKK